MDYSDFRLDEFLRVSKDVGFPKPDGTTEKVTVKVLSDLAMNAKQEYITAARTKMTMALRDPQSEEYQKKLSSLEASTRQELTSLLLQSFQTELTRQAQDLFRVDFLPLPDDPAAPPTPEEVTENRIRQKEHEDSIYAARAKYVIDGLTRQSEKYDGMSDEALLKEVRAQSSNLFSTLAGMDADNIYTIYAACRVDGKPKWSLDEVRELPERVINKLLAVYQEVDSVDPWELTKSLSERKPVRVGKNSKSRPNEPNG